MVILLVGCVALVLELLRASYEQNDLLRESLIKLDRLRLKLSCSSDITTEMEQVIKDALNGSEDSGVV